MYSADGHRELEVKHEELISEVKLYHRDLTQAKDELRARVLEVERLQKLCASREAKIIFYEAALAKIHQGIGAILAAPRSPEVIAIKEAS